MPTDAFLDSAESPFILLTTYRRTGVAVSTPVWVVRDGDRLLVTTGVTAGKVKRVAHTARVELVACDRGGAVTEGAPAVSAMAVVDSSPQTRTTLDAALLAKYGETYVSIKAAQRDRGTENASTALVITRADV